MPFQQNVMFQQALGIPGTFAFSGPHRVVTGVLQNSNPAANIIGNAAFIISGAIEAFDASDAPMPLIVSTTAADAGKSPVFAGLIVSPHEYTTSGTSDGALSPTMTMRNGETVQLALMGMFTVQAKPAAGTAINPGDAVYADASGNLVTVAAGGTAPSGGIAIPAVVHIYQAQTGLAVIRLTA